MANEFKSAHYLLLQSVKKNNFLIEITCNNKVSKKNRTFYQYHYPFIVPENEQGTLWRLERSKGFCCVEKYPILLPGYDKFVKLLIRQIHIVKYVHARGATMTLYHLRSLYLTLQANKVTKSVLAKCIVCMRFTARSAIDTSRYPTILHLYIEKLILQVFTSYRNDYNEKRRESTTTYYLFT